VIVLAELEGVSYKDIAAIVGIWLDRHVAAVSGC